jgi:hypothetical protein
MAKSATDKTIPNLENATPGFLVDEIKRLRVEASRLKFLEGVYKQALEARLTPEQLSGVTMVEGEKNYGMRKKMTQERVDTDAVREYFKNDPEELAKCMKLIEFWQWDLTPKVGDV